MIRYLFMDVDGTLTDGKIYMGPDGECFKAFDIKDGYAIANILPEQGITPVIITGRESLIVKRRFEELGVQHVYQGVKDKKDLLKKLCHDGFEYSAYIGDDLNDFDCMRFIQQNGGVVGCPADAAKEIIEMSDYVCVKNGGCGAVREFIDYLVKVKC